MVCKENVLKQFQSYLSNKNQYIEIEEIKNSNGNIKFGVPQGSILGHNFLTKVDDL